MRHHGRARRASASVDLTPMLDVVFILLIFFIVTSTFIDEMALGLEPPPPAGASDNSGQPITVHIAADNLIRVNGRLTDRSGVRANIERLRAETPDSPVLIQADPAAATGTVIAVRDAAESADVPFVSLIRSAEATPGRN